MALRILICNFLSPARHSYSRHNLLRGRAKMYSNVPEEVTESTTARAKGRSALLNYRYVYPEFLPDPLMNRRHSVREKLERQDMLNRRLQIEIPEFYVGSIMAVTVSDQHAPGKTNRFIGICIQRDGHGLRANFTLRNVVEHQGVEIMYEQYNPTILKIEVLRLEKRLDDDLTYLRDASLEHSTFNFNMDPEILPEGVPVPVNPLKVKLKPPPWIRRWELHNLKGIQPFKLPDLAMQRAKNFQKPWENYDLMKQYRSLISEEDQYKIFSEIEEHRANSSQYRKAARKKKVFVKPTKTA